MAFFIFIALGLGLGIWRGIVAHRKQNSYATSGFFVGVLFSVIGAALAVGCYLFVLTALPLNQREITTFKLDNLSSLVSKDGNKYYVVQNFGANGRQLHSFIIDDRGQTVLRSDYVIPSRIFLDAKNPRVDYVKSAAYYPYIFPLAIPGGGYQGQTLELHIPANSVYDNFHLPTDY